MKFLIDQAKAKVKSAEIDMAEAKENYREAVSMLSRLRNIEESIVCLGFVSNNIEDSSEGAWSSRYNIQSEPYLIVISMHDLLDTRVFYGLMMDEESSIVVFSNALVIPETISKHDIEMRLIESYIYNILDEESF